MEYTSSNGHLPADFIHLPTSEEALSVILKLVGEHCNIDCHYCYEKRKNPPEKYQLKPEILRRFLLSCANRELSIELHGGEPLLMQQKDMLNLLQELSRYDGKITLRIQTNGILLNSKWLDFFSQHWPSIEFGISLDGDRISNSHRKDYKGRETSELIEKNLELIYSYNINVGLVSVVTNLALNRAQNNAIYYSQFPAIKVVKFAPCFDFRINASSDVKRSKSTLDLIQNNTNRVPNWGITPLQFSDYLIKFWSAWKNINGQNLYLIEPHLSIMKKIHGGTTKYCHFSQVKCANVLTLYPDGKITSCDELSQDFSPSSNIDTNSITDITKFKVSSSSGKIYKEIMSKCDSCSYEPICGRGCLATRQRFYNTPLYDDYCQYIINLIDFLSKEIDG